MRIGIYLTGIGQKLISCSADDSIEAVARLLTRHHIGAMPVLETAGRMAGIISERDLVRGFSERGKGALELRARDLMTRSVVTCGPDETLSCARDLMKRHGFRHLPVVKDGKVCGIISMRDLLEGRLKERELEINVLRDQVIAARNR
ncbi:MAG: CBS domain-containing protein [Hyphomicrobiaceae bacterium]|nr:MAG: CBS domain-containing protein [Hyphomicrobiaceae bacterium]